MKHTKRTALLLSILMLSSALLASCSSEEHPSDDTSVSAETTSAPIAETTAAPEPEIPYDYIEKTYDGRTYTMATPADGSRSIPGIFIMEEETGDVVNDAVYRRNLTVKDKLDVKLAHVMPAPKSGFAAAIRSEIQAMNTNYDHTTSFFTTVVPLVTERLFTPSTELPYQKNISGKSWYGDKLNDPLKVNGMQYMFLSDMVAMPNAMYGMFFNVSLGERNGIKGVEQVVFDGKWTLDKLFEYTNDFTKDLNGNGTIYADDLHALGHYGNLKSAKNDTAMTYQYGFGQMTAVLNNQGEVELTLNSDKMQSIVERLNDLFFTGTRTANVITGATSAETFAEGRILFWNAILFHASNYMREMEDIYYALPMPKWDETQEEYYTALTNSSTFITAIPSTAKDKEFASAVFDALSYEGEQNVYPAVFEITMKSKLSADSTASKLFDLICSNAVIDFGMMYDGDCGMYTLIAKLMSQKSTNFASEFAAIKDKTTAHYKEVLDMFAKLS
ncbi:MAG: hypothetical protein E7662_00255 [Ruminococcaceae bacterium]|nr:hypothetical protein [Oscillospiraceae bacterium]